MEDKNKNSIDIQTETDIKAEDSGSEMREGNCAGFGEEAEADADGDHECKIDGIIPKDERTESGDRIGNDEFENGDSIDTEEPDDSDYVGEEEPDGEVFMEYEGLDPEMEAMLAHEKLEMEAADQWIEEMEKKEKEEREKKEEEDKKLSLPMTEAKILNGPVMTRSAIVAEAAKESLRLIPRDTPLPDVAAEVHDRINGAILFHNKQDKAKKRGAIYKTESELSIPTAALIIKDRVPAKLISFAQQKERDLDVVGVYVPFGEDLGLHDISGDVLWEYAKEIIPQMLEKDFTELNIQLRHILTRVSINHDRDIIAVNNGLFNYKSKELMSFSPDVVILSKCPVNYNPDAENVIIHNADDGTDWDIESGIKNFFHDDPERVDCLWKIIGAAVRSSNSWNKTPCFYSQKGNNGKGTLAQLIRNLLGEENCVTIPISSFGKEFLLEPLLKAGCIITDENDVGSFANKSGTMKATITHDVIQINRKHKTPVSFRYQGFMIQCVNEIPRAKDNTDSFYRRFLFVPFDQCFTGRERRYIKEDYIFRKEVLEYVLRKVLELIPDFYELPEPEACKRLMETVKIANDSVREFWLETKERFAWDFVPFKLLKDMYDAWYPTARGGNDGKIGRNKLYEKIAEFAEEDPDWIYPGKESGGKTHKQVITKGHMDAPEPLLVEFDLKKWIDPRQRGSGKCVPMCNQTMVKVKDRGILRAKPRLRADSHQKPVNTQDAEPSGRNMTAEIMVDSILASVGAGNAHGTETSVDMTIENGKGGA